MQRGFEIVSKYANQGLTAFDSPYRVAKMGRNAVGGRLEPKSGL